MFFFFAREEKKKAQNEAGRENAVSELPPDEVSEIASRRQVDDVVNRHCFELESEPTVRVYPGFQLRDG